MQARIPKYYVYRQICEGTLIICSIVTAAAAAKQLEQWTGLIAALMALVTAWAAFAAYDKKLNRYTNTIEKVSDLLTWWKSLPDIDHLMSANVSKLVDGCEDAFEREWDQWCSTGIARLTEKQSQNDASESGSAAQAQGDAASSKTEAKTRRANAKRNAMEEPGP